MWIRLEDQHTKVDRNKNGVKDVGDNVSNYAENCRLLNVRRAHLDQIVFVIHNKLCVHITTLCATWPPVYLIVLYTWLQFAVQCYTLFPVIIRSAARHSKVFSYSHLLLGHLKSSLLLLLKLLRHFLYLTIR